MIGMDIGSATASFAARTAWKQASSATTPPQTGAADNHGYQRSMGTTASKTSHLLANNFVTTDSTPSKYITATLSSLETANSFGDRMGALLDGLSAQYSLLQSTTQVSSGDGTYVAATLMQHRVEDGVKRTTEDEFADESARNLDDLKEDIEQRAEEATTPQDETTEGGQTDTTGKTDASAAADAGTSAGAQDAASSEFPTTPATETAGENAAQPSPTSSETPADAATAAAPAAVMNVPGAAYAVQQAAQTPSAPASVDMMA
ncbi:hypothetical protein DFW101_3257 [Solidesulfovibrio carbinoliphilus subsp. oakridgensis]|uniref:Uncharacterized protein n=2 Tax=Solidesulfovibrio carbinoliphilus TaxID=345370 RepID=G7QAM5_9BACT|nr:hypothetical protein DFW101_3257 [Solidesulfovibrio carbinoliphilus subsp. oakridgensis]